MSKANISYGTNGKGHISFYLEDNPDPVARVNLSIIPKDKREVVIGQLMNCFNSIYWVGHRDGHDRLQKQLVNLLGIGKQCHKDKP